MRVLIGALATGVVTLGILFAAHGDERTRIAHDVTP